MSFTTIPQLMKALVVQPDKTLTVVGDHPVPPIGENDVLVRTVAVALGPPDLLALKAPPPPGLPPILGCDWAGEIVQVGTNVNSRTVGQRVAGFVRGGRSAECGAFAEYVKSPADLVWPIPEALSFEEAAAMSIGTYTCAQALYHKGRLELPLPGDDVPERDEWVFIYGGSSSCGQYAIQLARASGFKVVTTSSPRNFDLLKSLGAAAVFDYHDPAVVDKVKAATGDTIRHGLDAIGQPETQELSQKVFGPAGGKLLTLMWANKTRVREDVELKFTLVHTGLGLAIDMPGARFPASPEDTAEMVTFAATVPRLVEQGRLRPNPIRRLAGGLAAIPEGLKLLEEGKVSGEKIVLVL
ncbi:oxidoreductase [Trametes versicolor FP-101664 SS1]|uniref:oxidoreductase n=1 Tax=Trametes versicolor (strain FP-101664) TaxID=717944 RepID=UPI000462162B|nr:oxidoreductase [Trametes versicolor FP-101664 SS1]EIW55702.1 oxidoreductase [Trametes versicolor FP-101664 SS1]